MNNEAIQKILENRPVMIVVMLGAAAGAVATIIGGFLMTYKILTFIGN
jgi:hypothetical protein